MSTPDYKAKGDNDGTCDQRRRPGNAWLYRFEINLIEFHGN